MSSRTIAIPRLLHVGSGCLGGLAALLEPEFEVRRLCVGSGDGPSFAFAERVTEGLAEAGIEVIHRSGLGGRLDQAAELAAQTIVDEVSLLVGVGGGRVIDTVKLAAARTNIDFISVPTTIAHDGISSPVASLAPAEGPSRSYAAAMPAGIIVDIEVIACSPERTLRAGAGDLVSNLTAILDWRLADDHGRDSYDAFSAMIAESAARPVLGLEQLGDPDSHERLAKGLLLSGLAMAAAGTSRPCSGAEHLISHSLDEVLGERAAMHGEQVALGCLFAAAAHSSTDLAALERLFARIGLPTRPADLGIGDDEMLAAIEAAPATRPERYTILSELIESPRAIERLAQRAFGG